MAAKKQSGSKKVKGGANKTTSKKTANTNKGVAAIGTVFLINMIPKALSSEFNQDSEPHLTVNPVNTFLNWQQEAV